MGEEEFIAFREKLKDRLLVTFRINPNLLNIKSVQDIFVDPEFLAKEIESHSKAEGVEPVKEGEEESKTTP